MKKSLAFLLLGLSVFNTSSFSAPLPPLGPPRGAVLQTAQERNQDSAYQEALRSGALIEPTADGISFTAWQAPENFDPKTGITFVSLHGHAGWATKDYLVWNQIIKNRGYAYLGIQWWYGRSAQSSGYAKPAQIYRWIDQALQKHGISAGRVILLGYSMGSANSYGVTLYDLTSSRHYFAVTIANSGPMESDFPLYSKILNGDFGPKPFQDTNWLLYCSMKDEELEDACEDMQQTQDWLTGLGGKVDWFYADPNGPHGGFMNPKVYSQALDLAEKILKEESSL